MNLQQIENTLNQLVAHAGDKELIGAFEASVLPERAFTWAKQKGLDDIDAERMAACCPTTLSDSDRQMWQQFFDYLMGR